MQLMENFITWWKRLYELVKVSFVWNMADFLLAVNTHMPNTSLLNIYIGAFEISATGMSFALKFLDWMAVQVFLNHLNLVLVASEITHFKAYFDLPWPWCNSHQNSIFEIIPIPTRLCLYGKNTPSFAFLGTGCGRIHWAMHLLTSEG